MNILLPTLLLLPTLALAHPGGLDSHGCHTNHVTGEYHCHQPEPGKRSASVRRQFLKSQGLSHTPEGCQVDHRVALMCGGSDTIENLQLLCGEALGVPVGGDALFFVSEKITPHCQVSQRTGTYSLTLRSLTCAKKHEKLLTPPRPSQ